jgi:hypothetical protein
MNFDFVDVNPGLAVIYYGTNRPFERICISTVEKRTASIYAPCMRGGGSVVISQTMPSLLVRLHRSRNMGSPLRNCQLFWTSKGVCAQ